MSFGLGALRSDPAVRVRMVVVGAREVAAQPSELTEAPAHTAGEQSAQSRRKAPSSELKAEPEPYLQDAYRAATILRQTGAKRRRSGAGV